MSFFSKKPTVWIVNDGTDSCIQSWAIARHIAPEKNIKEFDRLHAHSARKGFPDLAIGVGYGVTDTLEGIKEVSKGKTKIAVILDPLKDHDIFDFIILPSYEPYHVEGENVISSIGLANYINEDYLKTMEKQLKKSQKFGFLRDNKDLKPPFTAVIVGGLHTGGNVSVDDAKKIAEYTNIIVSKKGGTALVTTSARTEQRAAQALFNNLKVPHITYDYKVRATENPYDIFLHLAEDIIVTGDSVRMLCEACSSGKRVRIYKPAELGFQYEPLILELISNGHAVDATFPALSYKHQTLNEAKRIGEIIKSKL